MQTARRMLQKLTFPLGSYHVLSGRDTWKIPHPVLRAQFCKSLKHVGVCRAPAPSAMADCSMGKENYVLQDDGEEIGVGNSGLTAVAATASSPPAKAGPPLLCQPIKLPAVENGAGPSASTGGAGESPGKEQPQPQLFQCRMCLEFLVMAMFPKKNTSLCLECRRADEAAYAQVKGTAQESKFKELKAAGNEEYRALIMDCRKRCPAKGRGKGRQRYDFTTWFRTVESYNQVKNDARCRFMSEVYYLSWAQSPEGGCYTPLEAKARWDAWYEDLSVARDKLGKDGAERLLIHMFDEVIGSSATKSSRGYSTSGKSVKNATDEQLSELDALRNLGHDSFNSDVFDGVNGAGLSNALRGSSSLAKGKHNTAALAPVPNPEPEPEENQRKKKRKTDMRAMQVNQHDRLGREMAALLRESEETIQKMQEALDNVDDDDEANYKMYVRMLKVRKEAICTWAGNTSAEASEADVQKAIDTYDSYHTAACMPERSSSLPSPDFEHLVSRHVISREAKAFTDAAEDIDAIKAALKYFLEQKALAKNLLGGGARAVKDLASARKARAKTFEQQVKKEAAAAKAAAKAKAKEDAKAAGQGSRAPRGAQAEASTASTEPLPFIFSFASSSPLSDAVSAVRAKIVPTMSAEDFKVVAEQNKLDTSIPYLVQQCGSLSELVKKDEMINSKFSFFLRSFANSPQRVGTGRGTMNLPDMHSLLHSLWAFAAPTAVDSSRANISDKQFSALLGNVAAFAFAESMRYSGTEFKQAATMRFHMNGRRRCASAPFAELQTKLLALRDESATAGAAAKMKELGIESSAQLNPEVISQVLHAAGEEDAKELLQIFYLVDAGPHCVTYVPAGFFVLDVSLGSETVSGFRASLLVMNDSQVGDLKAIVQTFEHTGRDASLMLTMIQALQNPSFPQLGVQDIKKEKEEEQEEPGEPLENTMEGEESELKAANEALEVLESLEEKAATEKQAENGNSKGDAGDAPAVVEAGLGSAPEGNISAPAEARTAPDADTAATSPSAKKRSVEDEQEQDFMI